MASPSDAQRKWIEVLGSMGGGGAGLAPRVQEPAPDAGGGAIGSAPGGSVTAAPAGGVGLEPGTATAARFVPVLEVSRGFGTELAIGGRVTLELRVRNWAKRPPGTMLDWTAKTVGEAVDIELQHDAGEGEARVLVTGHFAGRGVVKAEVKVVGGGTYRFPDVAFVVVTTARTPSAFVPRLDAPRVPAREIAVKETVKLQLKVNNWAERPKGTVLDWSASVSGDTLDFDLEHAGGDGTVTVTGLAVGKGVVKASVTVKGGGTYSFWDTELIVVDDPDPDRSSDQGGVADVTNLEQDMRNVLQDWHGAARAGIAQFVTNALSKRIDKLESGSTKNFVVTLLGNVVWAAAAFAPGAAAFAISIVGIAVGSAPSIPQKSKSLIPELQKLMEDHIDGVFDQLDKSLRRLAKALLDKNPEIARFHALDLFVSASFKPNLFKANPKHTTIPFLDKGAIRDLFEREATKQLDQAIKEEEDAAAKRQQEWEDWQHRLPDEV